LEDRGSPQGVGVRMAVPGLASLDLPLIFPGPLYPNGSRRRTSSGGASRTG
jgi:hypothetical protein